MNEVSNIRAAVHDHFATHFKVDRIERPCLDNLIVKCLNGNDSGGFFRMFSEEETCNVGLLKF